MPNSTELYHLHFRQRENQTRWSLRSGQPWRSVLCFCFVISLLGASPCLQAVWSPISAGQTGPSEQGATRRFTLTYLDPSSLLLVPPLFQEGRKEDVFYLVDVSQSTPKIKYHFNSSWLWKLALQLPGVPHNPPQSKGLTLFSALHLLSAPLLSVWMELVAQGFRSGCCLVLSRGEC